MEPMTSLLIRYAIALCALKQTAGAVVTAPVDHPFERIAIDKEAAELLGTAG